MANGIQILPTLDRFAGLRQGAQNLVGGLEQQFQQRKQLADAQAVLQFIQQTQGGGQPILPRFQTAGGAAGAAQFLAQQPSALQQADIQSGIDLRLAQAGAAQRILPQPGFTLTPGGQRFDAQGKPIAQLAPLPRTPVALSPGQELVDPATGKQIALVEPDTLTLDQRKRADLIAAGIEPRTISKLETDQTKSIIRKNRAETNKLLRESKGKLTPEQIRAQATIFRKEFDALSKDFRVSRDSFNRVQASAQDPSAAGDLALIFNFMKVLDPGSVVRESEFANAAASGAFGERVKAAGLKILNGERLSPVVRADFLNRAGRLFEKQKKTQERLIIRYTKLSNRVEVDPADVITDIAPQEVLTPVTPQPLGIKDVIQQNLEGQTGRTPAEEARRQELLRKRGL